MAALLFPLFQWLPTFGWPSRIRTDISTRHSVALLPWGICALILSANPVFPSVRCLSISHPSAQCTFGIIILRLPCSGGRIRTADLLGMSQASWPLLYPAVSSPQEWPNFRKVHPSGSVGRSKVCLRARRCNPLRRGQRRHPQALERVFAACTVNNYGDGLGRR